MHTTPPPHLRRLRRRQFLKAAAAGVGGLAGVSAAASALAGEAPAKAQPSERLQVGCIGVGGRASALVRGFSSLKDVDIARVCDVDTRKLPGAAAEETLAKGEMLFEVLYLEQHTAFFRHSFSPVHIRGNGQYVEHLIE